MKPRYAEIDLTYNGKDARKGRFCNLQTFSYVDVASGESDSIRIDLPDPENKLIGKWMPKKGDEIKASLVLNSWVKTGDIIKFKCGSFYVDEFSFSGFPVRISLGALSIPTKGGFKSTERTKQWEKANIQAIAMEIAKRYDFKLVYEAKEIAINNAEQSEEADASFLYGLCEKYGLSMKVFSKKLIIFDAEKYEKKKAVGTIDRSQMKSFSYNTKLTKTYDAAEISYSDPRKGEEITLKVGKGDRVLKLNEQAENVDDAELIASAKVNQANRERVTMSVVIMGNPKFIASSNVMIKGLKKLDGKYAISKVSHNLSSSGYAMTLDLYKIQKRIHLADSEILSAKSTRSAADDEENFETENDIETTDTETTETKVGGGDYTVKKGDNLYLIAKQIYGSADKEKEIYEANKETIEKVAKERGKSSSNNGYWIWEGTKLKLPEVKK